MPQRTQTSDQNVVAVTDGRTYNFTDTAQSPHKIRIAADPAHDFRCSKLRGWYESHGEVLTCIKGRVHTFKGFSLYSSVDSFFGEGSSDNFGRWTLYSWGREYCGSGKRRGDDNTPGAYPNQPDKAASEPDLEAQFGESSTPTHSDIYDREVVVDISVNPGYWDQAYWRRFELFYRNCASMALDAHLYPLLPSTPFPTRLLFKLPRFLFPCVARNWLIAYFISIQYLVLFSAFDFHPYMGQLPIITIYTLLVKGVVLWPEQEPEWVCKWEWNTMIVLSHLKVAFWSAIGKRLLRTSETYEEHSPRRLTDSGVPGDAKQNLIDV